MPLVLTVPPYSDFDAVVAREAAARGIPRDLARWRVLSDLLADDDPTLDGEEETLERSLHSLRALLRQAETVATGSGRSSVSTETKSDRDYACNLPAFVDAVRRNEVARAGYVARRDEAIAARFAADWSRVDRRVVYRKRFDHAVVDLPLASVEDLYRDECAAIGIDPDDRAPARQPLADRVATPRPLPSVLPSSGPCSDPDRVARLRAAIEETTAAIRAVERDRADLSRWSRSSGR
jgi:hypothetical protein